MDMARLNDDEIGNVQGNILRGYTLPAVRHMILRISDSSAARAFLAASVTGGNPNVPQITTEQRIGANLPKLVTAFNLGFTYQGLVALGLAPRDLASFPTEFIEGMTRRAAKLSDFGDSDPSNWPSPYDQPDHVHVIATAYASEDITLDSIQKQVEQAFDLRGIHNGYSLPKGAVYFGYKDGLSQPRFLGFHDGAPSRQGPAKTEEPDDPLGTILLGKPTRLPDLKFGIPQPEQLGNLGTFNAFRVLKQDCFGFENFLISTAERLRQQGVEARLVGVESVGVIYPDLKDKPDLALREVIAAQLCGRWREGTPMQLQKTLRKATNAGPSNQFDYGDGALCPVGAHIRRNNPRGGEVVQRIANFTRRLVRRGMSYGDTLDLANPDDKERGLLGNFIGASLGAQFEAVMCDWLNLGLHSPEITGSNDPLLGANTPETSWFDLNLWKDDDQVAMEKHRVYGLPRFVTTRGGAYAFLPSLSGIQYLSGLRG